MKKSLLLILSALLLSANVFSVEKEEIKFGKEVRFSLIRPLGDGYVFPLVPVFLQTKNVFDYRGSNLEQKWSLELPPYCVRAVPSNDLQQVYYRQEFSGKVVYDKITVDGKIEAVELNDKDFDDGATKSMFCTDNYLYTLTVNDENKTDKYRLHRFDHKTFTHKVFPLDIPVDDKHVEYVYASFSGDNIFLVAKSSDPSSYSTTIVELDENGKLINKQEITPDFGGKEVFGISKDQNFGALKFGIVYSNRFTENAFVDIVDNASYAGDIKASRLPSNFRQVTRYSLKGDIVIEKASNAIYFYGYTEDNKLYVLKYDLKGKFIWRYDEAVKSMNGFIHLDTKSKDKIVFCETRMNVTLDNNGKPIDRKQYDLAFAREYPVLQNEVDKNPELKSFLESKDAKNLEEIRVWNTKDELILICKKSSISGAAPKKVDIYRFKKK